MSFRPTAIRAALGGVALAAIAALAWLLAPALGARPYLPPAESFGQRLEGVERVAPRERAPERDAHDEHAVTHRSAILAAPARFDVAGLAGELQPYEIRAREAGGEWTDWVETANGDPVWFGGADEVQVRTHGWRPSGQLGYVNVSGDATPLDAVVNEARGALSHVSVAAAGLFAGEPASASPPRPPIVTREEWGAERPRGGCIPRSEPEVGVMRAAVVHHTVSAVRYTREEAAAMVLAICRFHRNSNGWNDIGYNALVDRFGNVYEGRDGGLRRAVLGAHTQGFNAQTTGLASLGTHTRVPLSKAATAAAADFLAWKLVRHNKDATGYTTLTSAGGSASRYPEGDRVRVRKVIGHRRLGLTECPGSALASTLDELRRAVARRIAKAGGTEEPAGGIGRR